MKMQSSQITADQNGKSNFFGIYEVVYGMKLTTFGN